MTGTVHHKGTGGRRANALAAATHPHGRPAIWADLRRTGGGTVSEIANRVAVPLRTARHYLQALERAGILQRLEHVTGPRGGTVYQVPPDRKLPETPPALRPDGTPSAAGEQRDRLWRTMKMLKTFSISDLAVNASLPKRPVPRSSAAAYVNALLHTGYLAIMRAGGKWAGEEVYRFVRNTGPEAPQLRHTGEVFDQNRREVMPRVEVRRGRA